MTPSVTPPPQMRAPFPSSAPGALRRRRQGHLARRIGASGEERALRRYQDGGWRLAGRNWRADRMHGNGELDLIMERDGRYIFVEVKCRRTLLEAGESVTAAQRRRLEMAACRWLHLAGKSDALMRFDLVLIDRDGRMQICPNAFF